MYIKKGDTVKVLTGRERGKTGKVLAIIGKKNRVIVEKLNLVKRHKKPDASGKSGIVEKENPIHLSNVALFCNKCNAAVRVGYKILENKKKVRICKKCQEILDE
jgi:large subunit ribosomal protein L24